MTRWHGCWAFVPYQVGIPHTGRLRMSGPFCLHARGCDYSEFKCTWLRMKGGQLPGWPGCWASLLHKVSDWTAYMLVSKLYCDAWICARLHVCICVRRGACTYVSDDVCAPLRACVPTRVTIVRARACAYVVHVCLCELTCAREHACVHAQL
jgi:hypothetical protein